MHGSGKLEMADGSSHEGFWKEGKADGDGTHIWPSGTKYVGEWLENQKHGQGIMYYYDGRIEQGSWRHDQYQPCQCYTQAKDVPTAYAEAEAVFLGKIISVETREDHEMIEFEVAEYWKGNLYPGRRIFLKAGYSSCDFIFFQGETHLIFAEAVEDRLYQASKCSYSRKGAEMIDLLATLRDSTSCQQTPDMNGAIYYATEDLVCGCDDNTYRNPYEARKSGVSHWKAGECPSSPEKSE
jgi:hypothetical protein